MKEEVQLRMPEKSGGSSGKCSKQNAGTSEMFGGIEFEDDWFSQVCENPLKRALKRRHSPSIVQEDIGIEQKLKYGGISYVDRTHVSHGDDPKKEEKQSSTNPNQIFKHWIKYTEASERKDDHWLDSLLSNFRILIQLGFVKQLNHSKIIPIYETKFPFNSRGIDTFAAPYAVLVAGSSGWENYAHQSTVYQAYHDLIGRGFPISNIITMAVNDIIDNPMNPYPGVVQAYPNGPNVASTFNVDYIGNDVTALNFSNVLQGFIPVCNNACTYRVIPPNNFDEVFVFFVGYGGYEFINFPYGGPLDALSLSNIISSMYFGMTYSKMVIVIDAPQSGSMFKYIDANFHVLGIASSLETESSWTSYPDTIRGVNLSTLFGSSLLNELRVHKDDLYTTWQSIYDATYHWCGDYQHPVGFGDLDIANDYVFGYFDVPDLQRDYGL
ncbi:Peptidase C13, legumain like protein [Aduncisulcus paluster]|uniref:Peptidase C13, legumain like protein n=1 Tax=Aduncisulcus paluster TaxID=2918883 RepID=A0ABQ5K5Y2_9EUKA|nr:Peptidase C13, legumain like protein [Aduncisulcus paluster]